MELQGDRLIPATVEQTWAALNDPEVLKACIAGCESVERTGDDAFSAVVALKIGPVSARFKGNLKMTNITPPTGYTINFDGQGGVAGFGKGSADVALTPEPIPAGLEHTRLKYNARATVGGKMAQIGSRLVDATAAKLTEDFFKAFEAYLQARVPVPAEPQAIPLEAAAGGAAAAAANEPAGTPPSNADMKKLAWLIGAVVVLAVVYVLIQK